MRKPRLGLLTCWFLATTLLLAGVTPPGQRHAHVDGDVAHDHHDRYSQHNHHHSGGGHRRDNASVVRSASVAHVHFACWFFDLTLIPGDRTGSVPSEEDEGRTVYVVPLVDDCVPAIADDFDLQRPDMALPQTIDAFRSAPLLSVFRPHERNLLCDTARHERSGVQLF